MVMPWKFVSTMFAIAKILTSTGCDTCDVSLVPPSHSVLFLETFAQDYVRTISEGCKASRVAMPAQFLLSYG